MERLYSVNILFFSLKFTNSLIEKFKWIKKIVMQNVQLNIFKIKKRVLSLAAKLDWSVVLMP